ncbi:MAG: accessory gene regulator B family protein [Clostridiales bacterium]|jgi:accessory gene regulator B|nr:accessory gene regulator B family protein [Eubacteriales bacterium]MDH7565985.1 accessory gene regulator B family protein [Clostridiales bacterium]
MITISTISEGLTAKIRESIPTTDEKAEIIEYGIYMIISEFTKIAAILIISALLGITLYSLIAILAFGFLRSFAGGVHAKSHWGCFISYCIIIFGAISISLLLKDVSRIVQAAVLYPIDFFFLYLYSPADVINKPVISKKQRKQLRTGSFILLTLMFLFYLFLVPQPYANAIAWACTLECLTLLPIVYKVTGNKYGTEK